MAPPKHRKAPSPASGRTAEPATVLGDSLVDEGELAAFAKRLDAVRDNPPRKLRFSFDPSQLPRGKVLALSLRSRGSASHRMRFLFAHYRHAPNVRTWLPWMNLEEPDPAQVRPDGKRIVGRFEGSKQTGPLSEQIDDTDLRDLPATFELALEGQKGRAGGAERTAPGGAHVPHTMEFATLSAIVSSDAAFVLTLVGPEPTVEQVMEPEQTELDLWVTAIYASDREVTLFRSNHRPIERDLLRGGFLSGKKSAIEREAILSQCPQPHERAAAERRQRRSDADGLLKREEATLSPEQRRVVATLRQGEAQLLMSRVFGGALPPGPQRKELQAAAVAACETVVRLLTPLVAVDARYHDVGRAYWSASSLAHYYEVTRDATAARRYAQLAVSLVEQAMVQLPDEPELAGWLRSARERLTGARPGSSAPPAAARQPE